MDFQIGFTDKEITPWGGMALMKKMMDRCGYYHLWIYHLRVNSGDSIGNSGELGGQYIQLD